MSRYCFAFLIALLVSANVHSQVSKDVDEAYQLFKAGKYQEAEKKYEAVLIAPLMEKRYSFKGTVCYFLGRCAIYLDKPEKAIKRLNESIAFYNQVKEYSNVKDAMHYLNLSYKKAGNKYFRDNLSFDSTVVSNEVFFPVTSVGYQKGDTISVKIDGGLNTGIFEGAKGNLMLSYNSKRSKTLKNDFVATARVISVTISESVVEIIFFNKLLPANKEIAEGDLVMLKLHPPEQKINNIFYNLSALDVFFLNSNKDTLLIKPAVLNNTQTDLEEWMLDYYLHDLHEFYTSYLAEKTDTVFNTIYKKGRFKGMTMKESFRLAQKEDLYAFLHFVKSFPGKYMGKAWKINETYATWVLNEMPEGERGKQWMLPFIDKTPMAEIDSFAVKFSWYIENDSLISYRKQVDDLYTAKKYQEALTLCNKLYRIAQLVKDKAAELDFIYYRSYVYQQMGDMPKALADAKTALNLSPKNVNVASNVGYLYAKLENYDSCFYYLNPLVKANPDRYDVAGNLGWYKILAGNLAEAEELCKKAYTAENTSYSYAVNYGHIFLLKGNPDSARKYYTRSLENLYYPNDYADGPKKDFETFFTKGWSRKAVAEALDWMEDQYNNKYSYTTRGNVVWDSANKLYKDKKYKAAIEKWNRYVDVFKGMKEPPLPGIHNAYGWIGVCYEEMKDYDVAGHYYLKAVQMAKDTSVLADKLQNDYSLLYNLYTNSGNTVKAREYKLMYDVERQKRDDIKAKPRLYVVAVEGKNTLQPESKDNAKTFFETISNTVNKSFDSLVTYYAGHKNLSKKYVLGLLDSIKKEARPEDVLLLYYTGTVTDKNKEHFYLLKDDTSALNGLTEDELVNAVKDISSRKKLLISDVPSPGIMAKISETYSSVSFALNEVMFICPGVLTPVNMKTGISAFTEQLVAAVNELSKQSKFTAKDLINKTSEGLGLNKYYLPVLSFAFAKDFVLYRNETTRGDEPVLTRADFVEQKEDIKESPVADGKNYSVFIATDIYKEYQKLNNAVYDASELAKFLKNDFGFDTSMLINGTKDEMENKLIEYRDSKIYGDNDQLFIFFAGHGLVDKKENMGYLVASDSKKNDTKKSSFFSYSDLFNKYLKNIKCKRIFIVLDACHAGTFFDQSASRGDPPRPEAKEILKRNANGKKHYVGISSGSDEPVSDGNPGEHSPFAYSFMNTLMNSAYSNTYITAGVLIETLKANLPSTTMVRGGQFNTGDVGGQFIFELKKAPVATPNIKTSDLRTN